MPPAIHGPLIIGYGASAFLLGIFSLQVARYYRKYRKSDPASLKIVVLFVMLLELVHGSMACALMYFCFVTYFGDPAGLVYTKRLFSFNGLVSVLISSTVQIYSAYRLYKIAGSATLPVICASTSALRVVFYFSLAVFQEEPFPEDQSPQWRVVMGMVGALSVATDTLTAIALTIEFWRRRLLQPQLGDVELTLDLGPYQRRNTAILLRRGYSVTDQLILLCISSNILTCALTIIVFLLFMLEGQTNLAWFPISYIATRLYSISFICLVMQGRTLKQRVSEPESSDAELSIRSPNQPPRNVAVVSSRLRESLARITDGDSISAPTNAQAEHQT
ncbi:hypothetical protein FA15DRAFT_757762 [Coprinopsis marcescibilis]|uniref:Uncharacterized protein n=1 Tax=Coprinopsis marcescibilis TaxID=230819 RepID=A0A5C3KRF4_COPMA|nr:hypothetical protein FA15DRAFT_757762 [Coprinopsis marcescibilis]